MNNIIKDNKFLEKLNALDLIVIGILISNDECLIPYKNGLFDVVDKDIIESIKKDYIEILENNTEEKFLRIKIRSIKKIKKVSYRDIFNNDFLLQILDLKNSLIIGSNIDIEKHSTLFLKSKKNNYSLNSLLISFFIAFLFAGCMSANFDIQLVLSPVLFFLFFKISNIGLMKTKIIKDTIISVIIFLIYFLTITTFTFIDKDHITKAFNQYIFLLIPSSLIFVSSIFFSIYISTKIEFKNYNYAFSLAIFFIVFWIINFVFNI